MDNTINILSLCTGYGGMEIAIKRIITQSIRVVAVEIEAFAAANLVAKAEQGKLAIEAVYTDVKTFPSRKFRGCFDIITAGYPCQPFSHAGKRLGTGDPRHLWPFIRKHVAAIRPVCCIFENVAGHVTLGFDKVCQDLWALGYSVEAGLFTASEVGAPHKRERLFIMAYSSGKRWRGWIDGIHGGQNWALQTEGSSELAHGNSIRHIYGQPQERPTERGVDAQCKFKPNSELGYAEHNGCITSESRMWPSRPRQPQYDWEEPRTVKYGMGRTINGFTSRLDELRLLGNGIVPDCAEKAIRTLFERAGIT